MGSAPDPAAPQATSHDGGLVSRHHLYEQLAPRLGELARRALNRGLAPAEFLVVAIAVDDGWQALCDVLMPGHDWQRYRDAGETPIARGTVLREGVGDLVARVIPALAAALRTPPPPGLVHVVVLAYGGGTVYLAVPAAGERS